jgi:hypothetical protein
MRTREVRTPDTGLALWASTRDDVRVVGDSIADGILGNLERGSVTVRIIA